jgi:hypothetical protein
MAEERENLKHDSVGAWAERLYFAAGSVMGSVLRTYDLGSTQWYVLYQLANEGPTMQRDLASMLQIERQAGIACLRVELPISDRANQGFERLPRRLSLAGVYSKACKDTGKQFYL